MFKAVGVAVARVKLLLALTPPPSASRELLAKGWREPRTLKNSQTHPLTSQKCLSAGHGGRTKHNSSQGSNGLDAGDLLVSHSPCRLSSTGALNFSFAPPRGASLHLHASRCDSQRRNARPRRGRLSSPARPRRQVASDRRTATYPSLYRR